MLDTEGKHMSTRRAALLVGSLVVAACAFPTSPALTVRVLTPDGQVIPPATAAEQSTTDRTDVCCCRVIGRVINDSSIPVHVQLKFDAFRSGDGKAIGQALVFLPTMQSNEDRSFEAPGLVMPCDAIDSIELVDVDLRGIGGL